MIYFLVSHLSLLVKYFKHNFGEKSVPVVVSLLVGCAMTNVIVTKNSFDKVLKSGLNDNLHITLVGQTDLLLRILADYWPNGQWV